MPAEVKMKLATFLLLILVPAVTSYVNDWDGKFTFLCPAGQSISYMNSKHDNGKEDRLFDFKCQPTKKLKTCQWHDFANEFDEPVLFQCPNNGVITGIGSYHDNDREDRRYQYHCCSIQKKKLKNCAFSDYANDFDGIVDYQVPKGKVLKGMFSYHVNSFEDRRFKFETCDQK